MTAAAWAISIACQAFLLSVIWALGRRDWWTVFLAAGLIRSAILWPTAGISYFWVWVATEPIMDAIQFAAAREATQGCIREVRHIGLIVAASAFVHSIMLTADEWPTPRRAALLLRQGTIYGCAGLLAAPLAYGGQTDPWMLAYYILHCARVVAEQVSIHNTGTRNAVHLLLVSSLFCGWAIYGVKRGNAEPNAR